MIAYTDKMKYNKLYYTGHAESRFYPDEEHK